MSRLFTIIFFLVTSAAATINAASIPAFTLSGGTVDFTQFQFTIGNQFFVGLIPITVTNLGIYSVSGLAQPYEVGLWDSAGNLLASASVPASTLFNQFVYVPITPVFLPGNKTYRIGELVNSTATWLADPQVTYTEQVFFETGLYDQTESPTLTDPLALTLGHGGAFGPSFEYTFVPPPPPAPEPGTGSLIIVTAIIGLILRQRIRPLLGR